jgi:hypothetical protein
MGSEPGVVGVVTEGHAVTLAVRDELQDRRDRLALRPRRKPELSRQADPVGHRNPNVLYYPIGQCITRAWP